MSLSPSRIVCAAIRFKDGLVLSGPRHFDLHMHAILERVGTKHCLREEEGFIDQHGNFFTRHDAWLIANANGQILYRCGGDETNGGTLYSENLY